MTRLTRVNLSSTDDTHAPVGVPCVACGAPHDPEDGFCAVCGTEFSPATSSEKSDEAKLTEEEVQPVKKHFRCKNCGAEVVTDPDQRSYVCAFCDSTYVVEFDQETSDRQRPEFVIGFTVTPEEALEKFRRWLSDNPWFRPGDLAAAKMEGKLRGVYLPFWSFPMLAKSRWSATIGEHWYRTETYTTRVNGKTVTKTRRVQETEWWPLSGEHHRHYYGFLVSGSRGLPQGEAERIKPFYLQALKRYKPYYLAGWLAEEYSIDHDSALEISQREFLSQENRNIQAFMPGNIQRDLRVSTQFEDISSDLILLPIYILSYRYQDKVYRFLLNGQTGKADGDKPISNKRIGFAVAAVGVLVLITLLLMGIFK